jgi:hypothetical protein
MEIIYALSIPRPFSLRFWTHGGKVFEFVLLGGWGHVVQPFEKYLAKT